MNMSNNRTKKDLMDADIIAIGAIKYDTKTGEIEKFKSLIKPITNLNIYPHIQELTKISQDDIIQAPSYEDVMRKFKAWLGEYYQIVGRLWQEGRQRAVSRRPNTTKTVTKILVIP